ncbi:MAG: hypothetical protein ACK5UQ_23155 [Planctomycetota bacterium]|jgi:hypothetical protein
MSASRTVSPAEERLLDAALQQLFADAAARTAPRRSPHWLLVAMLLLGLGVTATLMWQASEVQRDEAQDSQRGQQADEVRVQSRAELDALPATTTHVRWSLVDPRELPAIERFEALRALRLVAQEGTLFGLKTGYHRSWTDAPAGLLQPLAKLKMLEVLGLPSRLLATQDVLGPLADHPTLHTVDLTGAWPERPKRPILPLGRLPQLRAISLDLMPIDAATLREVAKLPLTSFELKHCRGLDADGWQALCTMRTLQRLSFSDWSWNVQPGRKVDPPGWRPTPNDLQRLHELPALRTLELMHCSVDAAQLEALPDTLTSLHLFGTRLGADGIDGLRRFGALRELRIDTRKRSSLIASVFDDDPVPEADAFALALATLRLRSLHYYGALVPAVATAIGSQPDLRELTIDSKVLAPEPLAMLLATARLETLRLRRTLASNRTKHQDLSPALAGQHGLRTLELCVHRDDDLATLTQLPSLEHVALRFSSDAAGQAIDAAKLAPLARCPALREVDLELYTIQGQPPLATEPLQNALGPAIRLRVKSMGEVQR